MSASITPVQGTAVQVLSVDSAVVLHRDGKASAQLLWPENAPDAQVTITRVVMQPGSVSDRHRHRRSEQTWLVERGAATLLLADGQGREIRAGDLVRTPAGVVHGVENTGTEPFVYLSITTPPEDFSAAYDPRA